MEKKEYIGFIHNNQFFEIIINKNQTEFFENLKPMIARLPDKLNIPANNEGNIVLIREEITSDGTKPVLQDQSGQLPDKAIQMLLNHSSDQLPSSFLSSKVGGSVNFPIRNH